MALLSRKTSTGPTPVQAALDTLDQTRATVARWESEQAAKTAELADLEARIGAEVLADETAADRLAEQTAKLRAGIDVAGRTARAASDRVTEAGRAVLRAYSAELKANADHLRAEVEQRQAKTDAMLKALTEWEGGCRYVPWEPARDATMTAGSISYKIPQTQALRNQVSSLDAKAAQYAQYADGTPEQVGEHVARLAAQNLNPTPATVNA
jgi:hypothetical protein